MTYLLKKHRDYTINPDKPYNLTEAGEKLGVSADTVRRIIEDRELKAYKVRTCWRIKGAELLRYMKKNGYEE